ncbi:MAG: FKBP-type peptidyl-prolyl cis-trans isomerase [Candidatus Thermoplasmatota archaeon]
MLRFVFTFFIIFFIAFSGCIFPEKAKISLPAEIKIINNKQKISAGNNTTFIATLKNKVDNDTFYLSTTSIGSGWNIWLNKNDFILDNEAEAGVFIFVESSKNVPIGKYSFSLICELKDAGEKVSKSIYIEIIEKKDVEKGKKVKVDYFGYLGDYKIFDTSIEEIGNNKNIPKAESFRERHDYEPLEFLVGSGDMIQGFDAGVVGMGIGETKRIKVESREGYGKFENATINMTETINVYETMNLTDFKKIYKVNDIKPNMVFVHSFWKWYITILALNEENLTFINMPNIGEKIKPYGWDTIVLSINSSANSGLGEIVLFHKPMKGMNMTYANEFPGVVKDIVDDKIYIEYNSSTHKLGKEVLYFVVTVLEVI